MAKINKNLEHFLKGNFVNLREVKLSDAEFIVKLRNSARGQFLNAGASNVEDQQKWLQNYFLRENEYYFIIESKNEFKQNNITTAQTEREREREREIRNQTSLKTK